MLIEATPNRSNRVFERIRDRKARLGVRFGDRSWGRNWSPDCLARQQTIAFGPGTQGGEPALGSRGSGSPRRRQRASRRLQPRALRNELRFRALPRFRYPASPQAADAGRVAVERGGYVSDHCDAG